MRHFRTPRPLNPARRCTRIWGRAGYSSRPWRLNEPVNVNLGKSSDPELEQQILDDVGTYGRQLGQIGDALNVLLKHVNLDSLKPEEKQAIDAFRYQLGEIARLKAKRRAGV